MKTDHGERSKTYTGPNIKYFCTILTKIWMLTNLSNNSKYETSLTPSSERHPVQMDRGCHFSHVEALDTSTSDNNCDNMLIGQVCDRTKLYIGRQIN
jgi:hypothetical protein